MGTRHLIVVVANDEPKIAQYGQWDGYPEGQGMTILNTLSHEDFDLEKFKSNVLNCRFLSEKEVEDKWVECGAERGADWVDMNVSNVVLKIYPELSRDTGAKIIKLVYDGKANELQNHIEFAKNSLWCEWAYVVDLDKNKFEVYKGFIKDPINEQERFYNDGFSTKNSTGTYYPVELITSFDLLNLPSSSDFINYFDEPEEED